MRHLLSLVPLGLVACVSLPAQEAGQLAADAATPELTRDDAIRAAVFRHLFTHNVSGQQTLAEVYCLQVEGERDPSPALLEALAAEQPRVRPVSACVAGTDDVRERATDQRGLVFRVDKIRLRGRRAVVEGGYFEAGLSASGNTYVVEQRGERWVVTSERLNWIA